MAAIEIQLTRRKVTLLCRLKLVCITAHYQYIVVLLLYFFICCTEIDVHYIELKINKIKLQFDENSNDFVFHLLATTNSYSILLSILHKYVTQ